MDRIWKVYRLTPYYGPQGQPFHKRTHLYTVCGGTFDEAYREAIARFPYLAKRDGLYCEIVGELAWSLNALTVTGAA